MSDSPRLEVLQPSECSAILRAASALVFVDDLDALALDDEDVHHLAHVLRLAAGEQVIAADGKGAWRLCRLGFASESPKGARPRGKPAARVLLDPISTLVEEENPIGPLTIGFGLQKGDRPEWTVQKLTELGIDRILPFFSVRSVVRLDQAGARRRGERLRKVAREAAAQSRRARLPEIADPAPLEELLAAELGPVHFAEPGGGALSAAVSCVFVGPEGGWAPAELELGKDLVGLGRTILRAETAAVVAASLLAGLSSGLVRPA